MSTQNVGSCHKGVSVKINRIYIDLDGVLSDFVGGVLNLFHKSLDTWPPGEYRIWKAIGLKNDNEFWKEVDRLGHDFWASLEPYPWRDKLFDACEAIADTGILTSPSLDSASASGKQEWIQNWKGREFRDFGICPGKDLFAHAGAVLIDDSDKNCEDFTKAGGRSILFPRRWNSDFKYEAQALEMVLTELE